MNPCFIFSLNFFLVAQYFHFRFPVCTERSDDTCDSAARAISIYLRFRLSIEMEVQRSAGLKIYYYLN